MPYTGQVLNWPAPTIDNCYTGQALHNPGKKDCSCHCKDTPSVGTGSRLGLGGVVVALVAGAAEAGGGVVIILAVVVVLVFCVALFLQALHCNINGKKLLKMFKSL